MFQKCIFPAQCALMAAIVATACPRFLAAADALVPAKDGPEFAIPADREPAQIKEFAFVFSQPYGQGDEYPRDPEEFDRMLGLLKSAGYNTVHCPPAEWRPALFKKHGMKMMVDVLAWKPPIEADIRRNDKQRERLKQFILANRDSDAIWGYNLWNERLDWCGDFKQLDLWLRQIRTWDPKHPVWIGTYRTMYSENYPTPPGVLGYYDYHWARGHVYHFAHLKFYRDLAEKRKCTMGRWMSMDGYNRSLYTLNTSIAFGLKTGMWFIGGPYGAREPDKSKRWDKDSYMIRIAQHVEPTYKLIGEMGRPVAVYSTPTLRTADNLDKKLDIPGKIDGFPTDHWLQIKQGEVLCGFFKLADQSEVVWVANHNADAWQGVVLEVEKSEDSSLIVSEFNREKRDWEPLGARSLVNFALSPADARIFRFEQGKPGETKLVDDDMGTRAEDYNPQDHYTAIGKLLAKRGELAEGMQPVAVYAHPTMRTRHNRSQQSSQPEGSVAFPEDFPVKLKQGELLAGQFKLKDGSYSLCFANHNALAWQGGLIVPRQDKEQPTTIWQFDQKNSEWVELGTWGDVNFPVAPRAYELLKFKSVPSKGEVK